MSRELVSVDALRTHLEGELHKFQECNRYRVTGITKLQTPDAEGCNWSPRITLAGDGKSPRGPCASIVERIVAEARQKFNLA